MPLHDLSGGKIRYGIFEKYFHGFDLLIGENDSLEFLKSVPDKSVKLIVTSPPYNISKVYEERVKLEEYLKYQSEVTGILLKAYKLYLIENVKKNFKTCTRKYKFKY